MDLKLSHLIVALVFLLLGGWIGAKWPSVNLLTKVMPAG